MGSFSQIKKNLKKDFSNLRTIKLAFLGDTSTQFHVQALRGVGYDNGFDLQVWESDFNQIERQVFDPTSELYAFKPEIVIVFQSSHRALGKYNKLNPEEHRSFADKELELIENINTSLTSQLDRNFIFLRDSIRLDKLKYRNSDHLNSEGAAIASKNIGYQILKNSKLADLYRLN
jgi:predicted enzyme involved in methoxymalonyl-ACP biosynthesis